MFSFAEVFFSRGGHTQVKINTFQNAKRERGFSVRPRAALPVFFISYLEQLVVIIQDKFQSAC